VATDFSKLGTGKFKFFNSVRRTRDINSSKNASMNIRNGSYKLAGAVFLSALSSVFFVAAVTLTSPATAAAPAAYVPDEIIVKFGKTLADRVKEVISKGQQARDIELSDSLDELHKKYRLRSAKPLFKNFKRDCQRLEALHKKDKTLLTKKEKQNSAKTQKGPKGCNRSRPEQDLQNHL